MGGRVKYNVITIRNDDPNLWKYDPSGNKVELSLKLCTKHLGDLIFNWLQCTKMYECMYVCNLSRLFRLQHQVILHPCWVMWNSCPATSISSIIVKWILCLTTFKSSLIFYGIFLTPLPHQPASSLQKEALYWCHPVLLLSGSSTLLPSPQQRRDEPLINGYGFALMGF